MLLWDKVNKILGLFALLTLNILSAYNELSYATSLLLFVLYSKRRHFFDSCVGICLISGSNQ